QRVYLLSLFHTLVVEKPMKEGVCLQIHVVQSGDTLYEIAQTYGSSVNKISDVNEIDPSTLLVVGQTLVIPMVGRCYFVHGSVTLDVIAQSFCISVQAFAKINGMSSQFALPVVFRIFIPPQNKGPIAANAYIEPTSATVSDTLENAARKNAS